MQGRYEKLRQWLDEWWRARIEALRRGEPLEEITIRGILYLARKAVGVENVPPEKRKSRFYGAVETVERRYGVDRSELMIITEPKIDLITRYGEKPVLKAKEWEISNVCALLYMEKGTIVAAIERDQALTMRGIWIVKAMGFSTRDVNKVIALARETGVVVLVLTDLDPSGIVIERAIHEAGIEVHRVGIDLELLEQLGVDINDVREALPREPEKLSHLKSLPEEWQRFFIETIGDGEHPYRIEIDGVWALAGKRRFMAAILARADQVLPQKPLSRVLVPRSVPAKVGAALELLRSTVQGLYEGIRANELQKYDAADISFSEINLRDIESAIGREIDRKGKSGKVVRLVKKLVKELKLKGGG